MSVHIDALNTNRLQEALQQYSATELNKNYRSKISCFDSIDSTNTWLLKNGDEGDFCLSETQTAGRGRRDNQWISPSSGNIYLSHCCYFDELIEHRSLLGLIVGIAIAETLQEVGLKGHGIKWPNDIFWQGKKLGGILIQTAENYEKFVIGIGLNVNLPEQSKQEITQVATSLNEAMKTDFKREDLIICLMQNLLFHMHLFPQLAFSSFLQSWKRWDILQGQTVSLRHQGSELSGVVVDIDRHGRIGILLNSQREYFSAADIKLQKPTGNV